MSNKKISQLNLNTTPSLSDVIPVVNNNETKKITLNGLKDFIGGTSGNSNYIEITKTELDTLISNSTLVKGAIYKITEIERWMKLGDSTKAIYLHAISNNTLETKGHGEFYVPKYNKNIDGYGIWVGEVMGAFTDMTHITYNIGDTVIWGGRKWTNTTGNVGTSDDKYTLNSADWVVVPFDDTNYNIQKDIIEYDYEHDMIIYRKDDNGNEISTSYENWKDIENDDFDENSLENSFWNPLKIFQWGNKYDYDINKGQGFNIVINSILENINTWGTINSNTLNNGYIYYNILKIYGSIFYNTINNGEVYHNTIDNGSIYYNTLENGGRIYYNTFENGGRIYYNTLETRGGRIYSNTLKNNGQIYLNTLNNGQIDSNTINNGQIYSNTLENSGQIDSNTLENSGQIDLNILTNGRIYSNTIENTGRIYSNTINNGQIYSNTLNGAGEINTNTLDNGSIYSNTIENTGQIYSNTLNNGIIRLGLTNPINNKVFKYNIISMGADIGGASGINLSSANLVYQNYTKTIFKDAGGTTRISYYDSNGVLTIANITD